MLDFQYDPESTNVGKTCSNEKLEILNRYEKSTPAAPMIEFSSTFIHILAERYTLMPQIDPS